jgi:hypothetical protein
MIRFLADVTLRGAIVRGCRRREATIDFLSAHRREPGRSSHPDVLALAADQDRILVSHDFQTMPRHFADFVRAYGSSPGVILVPQCWKTGQAIEELLLIWGASDAEEWRYRILTIPLR